jgi:hypothetical protein
MRGAAPASGVRGIREIRNGHLAGTRYPCSGPLPSSGEPLLRRDATKT